jgi:hypothetical protein
VQASRTIVVLVALSSIALFPSPAAAQRCADDGVAAIDQYCELLPGATGAAPIDDPMHALNSVLPTTARVRLARAGPEGRALLAMPAAAPVQGGRAAVDPLPGAAKALEGRLAERNARGGVLRAISDAAWDGGQLSDLFRSLLLLATLGLVGTAWARRAR